MPKSENFAPMEQEQESQALDLIIEAINYCKKVRDLGMPKSCYAKTLREPIFFLWEKKPKISKYESSTYKSAASVAATKGPRSLVYDHSIPFNYTLERLIGLPDVNQQTVRACLSECLITCTITKEEDERLNRAGLRHKMPDDWDGVNPLARYQAVNIQIHNN